MSNKNSLDMIFFAYSSVLKSRPMRARKQIIYDYRCNTYITNELNETLDVFYKVDIWKHE